MPYQAHLKTAGGASIRTHYSLDGSLSKIVDETTGTFVVVKQISDVLGADYLAFSSSCVFQTGYSLYRVGSTRKSATVLGEFGQMTANLAGQMTASLAIKPVDLVYGPASPIASSLSAILSGGGVTARSPFGQLIGFLLPTAQAQSFTTSDRASLYWGGALAIPGGLAFSVNPVVGSILLGAGALQIGRAYSGIIERSGDLIQQGVDSIFEGRVTNDLNSGEDPIDSLRSSIGAVSTSGLTAIRDPSIATITRTTTSIAGLIAPSAALDATPAQQPLPFASAGATAVSGTMVDNTNAVYELIGTLNSTGSLSASASLGTGISLTLQGQINTANRTIAGNYSRVNANGQATAQGTLAGTIVNLGKCQTATQSGGLGTFSYAYNLGVSSDSFSLTYDVFSIPDVITVVVGGRVAFSSNWLVSGTQTRAVSFSGGDTAFVSLSAPNSGTQWTFTIGCGA